MNRLIRSEFNKIILIFIIWRVILLLIVALAPYFIPQFGAKFPYSEETLVSSNLPYWIWSFGNFDGVHYLRIAQDGYAYQFTQAFFPFYPILIKLVSFLTFGNFPTSFYFGAVYTEGLFFLMIIAAFYLVEINKIWQASVIGALASGTRLVGIFLTPALAIGLKHKKKILPLTIVPIGLLVYIIYLKLKFNNPLYFLTSQAVWGQERSTHSIILLPQVIWRYLKILVTTNGLPLANAAFELLATLFALTMLIIGFKKIKREWLVFSLLAIVMPTLTGTLASMPRYIIVAFPIFIVLAQIKSLVVKIAIIAFFLVGLIFATALFTRGYWVA